MDSGHHLRFNAQERSYLAVLKKDIRALALEAGFSESRAAEIDIVVAELGSNLVKHARAGEMLVRVNESGLEIICIDSGPGMSDVRMLAADGVSTTRTLGQGLGAIRRLSDDYDIYSQKGWGTVSVCRFYLKPNVRNSFADIHSLVLPKPGERACGDGFAIDQQPGVLKVMLGDGLGHGPEAQAVVSRAEAAFMAQTRERSPVELLRAMHLDLKRSRGLVATVAVYQTADRSWHVSGIGNIYSWLGNQQTNRNVMSYNGIVGVNMPGSMSEYAVLHEYGHLLILCSDGFRTRWDLQKYPAILKHDLSLLAAALYKDFNRGTDDLSILIVRIKQQS